MPNDDPTLSGNAWTPDTLKAYAERPEHPANTDPAWEAYHRRMEELRSRGGRQKRRGKKLPPMEEGRGIGKR